MDTFKPILASAVKTDKDFAKLKFPLIATPKLDGIRVLKREGVLMTRSLKPIRNSHIQSMAHLIPDGLDGEIMTYSDPEHTVMNDFNTIQSHVMRGDGVHNWLFHVFDDFSVPTLPYIERLNLAQHKCENNRLLRYVEHVYVSDLDALMELSVQHVEEGWEGTMVRKPMGPYKFGRSSVNEGILLKIKKFDDDEATVVGVTQLMSNQNEITQDLLGNNVRKGGKDGMVPKELMGSLVLEWNDTQFEVGTGFTMDQRKELWENRDKLNGSMVTFKYQGVGTHGRPRFPVFLGFRSDLDA